MGHGPPLVFHVPARSVCPVRANPVPAVVSYNSLVMSANNKKHEVVGSSYSRVGLSSVQKGRVGQGWER